MPWRTNDEDPSADGKPQEVLNIFDHRAPLDRDILVDTVPKGAMVSREDLKEHGYAQAAKRHCSTSAARDIP